MNNNIFCFISFRSRIVLLSSMFWMLSFNAQAQEFQTVHTSQKPEAGLNFNLEVKRNIQTGFPSELRVSVENITDTAIEIAYPLSTGPVIFGISYMGESGSTRPRISHDGDSFLYDELLPDQITYWSYTMEDLLNRAEMSIDEVRGGERLTVLLRIRFSVPAPTEDDPDNRQLIEEGLGLWERT